MQTLLATQVAAAAPLCAAAFSPLKIEQPKSVLTTEYDRSEILAIGVNDHSQFQGFDHLASLIRARGDDPKLKTIVIEDSSTRAELYNELSVTEMSFDEFKRRATSVYGMFSAHETALFEKVLPAVREINRNRPRDPILVTSIDGMNNQHALEVFAQILPIYATSLTRERETARTFQTDVVDRFPGRKILIAYQSTHVAKNLSAIDSGQRAPLGWLSIAREKVRLREDKVSVVLVDNIGEWSTTGVLNLPDGILRPQKAPVAFTWSGLPTEIDTFKAGTFLRNYREGTVALIDPFKPVFDAVILEP